MPPKLEFCLLGPVVVRCGEVALPVPRGRQRALLAVLLLNAGRVVSVSEIADTLWGSAPLPSAEATVRNYVKRLRRVLGDAGPARIVTRSPGYLIRVEPSDRDPVHHYPVLAEPARAARRSDEDGPGPALPDQLDHALDIPAGPFVDAAGAHPRPHGAMSRGAQTCIGL
jgi:Transcriptional regulatory protein, C terminal